MSTIAEMVAKDLNNPSRPPLCIDCHWIARSSMGNMETHRCLCPNNYKGINLVDGFRVYHAEFCINHRTTQNPQLCGVDGTWFKQAEALPPPVKVELSNVTPAERFKQLRATKKLSSTDLENL